MTSLHLAQGSRQPQPSKNRLILYGNRLCPYAQRVRLILDAKKLQYDIININLANKPDWYFDISPMGKVPALQLENGDVLYESLIITDYLDEKYPQNTLLPKDPLQKAKDKLFLYNFNKVIGNMYGLIMNSSKGCFDDQDVVIMEGLASIQTELRNRKGGQFFGGARPGCLIT